MTQEQIDQWIKENQTYNAQELDRGPVIPVDKVRELLQATPPAAVLAAQEVGNEQSYHGEQCEKQNNET